MNANEYMAMSLPYGLKIKSQHQIFTLHYYKDSVQIPKDTEHISIGSLIEENEVEENVSKRHKPILRPLSDITKPCLVGGLIPIIELSKLAGFKLGYIDSDYDGVCICDNSNMSFFYSNQTFTAGRINYKEDDWIEDKTVPNQLSLFQKLVEWHFDICGLIESSEAVDYHTLPDFVF